MYIYTYIHIYIYTYTQICIYVHFHTYAKYTFCTYMHTQDNSLCEHREAEHAKFEGGDLHLAAVPCAASTLRMDLFKVCVQPDPGVPGNESRCFCHPAATTVTQTAIANEAPPRSCAQRPLPLGGLLVPAKMSMLQERNHVEDLPEALDTGLPGVQPSQRHPGAELQPKPSRIFTRSVNSITSRSLAQSRPHPA